MRAAVPIRHLLLIMLLALSFPGRAHAAEGIGTTHALRFGAVGASTLIALDLDRAVDYRAYLVDDNGRLFIDLPPLVWSLPASGAEPFRGIAQGQEFGLVAADRSRLVVDLSEPAVIDSVRLLPPGAPGADWRLVVALRPISAPPPVDPSSLIQAANLQAVRSTPLSSGPDLPVTAITPQTRTAALGAVLPQGGPDATLPIPAEPPVVVIDPGHGGIDPGAIGINGVREKDVVLALARAVQGDLNRDGNVRVVLTRDDDTYVRLRERLAKARDAGASLLVSLHADSLPHSTASGASVYTLSTEASDAEASRLASKENKADILSAADLSHQDSVVAGILIDLAQRDTNNRSIALAETLADSLAGVTSVVHRSRRFAGFAVLKSPDVPSALVELGYLSNPRDAQHLGEAGYQAKLADAIARAIERYLAVSTG